MVKGEKIVEFAGRKVDFSAGCVVMGVINVTPDSFSDGGEFFEKNRAVARGLEMAGQGAAIIDIGAESTRPGAESVSAAEQIKRVIAVIEALCEKTDAAVSIDTRDVEVARAAIEAGAVIVNDISGMRDEAIGTLAAEKGAGLVLMHMQGQPATMQIEPKYEDVVGEVLEFLVSRAKRAEELGATKERIFIDPGIGFGKTVEHNLLLLKNIEAFADTSYRVLVGASRKSFLGKITGKAKPYERIFGTAATVALCAAAGVSVVRVHDAKEMADVVKVANAIRGAG